MDLAPFKLDIDELLNDYVEGNFVTLTDFKRLWLSKKFSYIYEGRPSTNSAVFMQSLFAHCIGKILPEGSLSRRFGGLYCLYCLYETQPYKPCFKIYLSFGELQKLKELVVVAKQNDIGIVPDLVKRMLDSKMFLFGCADTFGDNVAKKVDELTKVQDKRVQIAYDNLFEKNHLENSVHMDLGVDLELESFKKMSAEYNAAKQLAISEVSQTVDVDDVNSVLENGKSVGARVDEIIKEWNVQKEEFCEHTGIRPPNQMVAGDEFDELQHLLDE